MQAALQEKQSLVMGVGGKLFSTQSLGTKAGPQTNRPVVVRGPGQITQHRPESNGALQTLAMRQQPHSLNNQKPALSSRGSTSLLPSLVGPGGKTPKHRRSASSRRASIKQLPQPSQSTHTDPSSARPADGRAPAGVSTASKHLLSSLSDRSAVLRRSTSSLLSNPTQMLASTPARGGLRPSHSFPAVIESSGTGPQQLAQSKTGLPQAVTVTDLTREEVSQQRPSSRKRRSPKPEQWQLRSPPHLRTSGSPKHCHTLPAGRQVAKHGRRSLEPPRRNRTSAVESSWDSLAFFNRTHLGRLSASMDAGSSEGRTKNPQAGSLLAIFAQPRKLPALQSTEAPTPDQSATYQPTHDQDAAQHTTHSQGALQHPTSGQNATQQSTDSSTSRSAQATVAPTQPVAAEDTTSQAHQSQDRITHPTVADSSTPAPAGVMQPTAHEEIEIPELPLGQTAEFELCSTWGDSHYIGMCGLEFFDDAGELIQFKHPESQVRPLSHPTKKVL